MGNNCFKYRSTRGKVTGLTFEEATMMGLADDGGLLIPEKLPNVSDCLEKWKKYSFQELACAVIYPFVEGSLSEDELKSLVYKSYGGAFRDNEITPVVQLGSTNICILELFHGPTFAFKDVALQLLGNFFEFFLERSGRKMTVLGATSGDTGSAAIYGLRGKKNIEIFMLHPYKKVSPIQELQMTTVLDENVHNIAVDGTFDDAQELVKALFNDLDFKRQYNLGAVNSINWARIVAQIVYYFYAYFHMPRQYPGEIPVFSVPTGNFGDILAGYYAQQMGLPCKLIIATNQNDILYRAWKTGEYFKKGVIESYSPSMDIEISSNFERYLLYACGNDFGLLNSLFSEFKKTGKMTLPKNVHTRYQKDFEVLNVSEIETSEMTSDTFEETGYLLDPHTAVGAYAASRFSTENTYVALGTAHPAKFANATKKAIGKEPDLPEEFKKLMVAESRCHRLKADSNEVKDFIMKTLN